MKLYYPRIFKITNHYFLIVVQLLHRFASTIMLRVGFGTSSKNILKCLRYKVIFECNTVHLYIIVLRLLILYTQNNIKTINSKWTLTITWQSFFTVWLDTSDFGVLFFYKCFLISSSCILISLNV